MGWCAGRGGEYHPTLADQQQQQLWEPSPRASQAFELYRVCIAAGQRVKFSVEQRREGEYIFLSCRPHPPTAAAREAEAARGAAAAREAAAARGAAAAKGKKAGRKPNKRRAAKQQAWRDFQSSLAAARRKRQQQPQETRPVCNPQQQQQATASSSCSLHQQQATANSSYPEQQQATARSSWTLQQQQATASSSCPEQQQATASSSCLLQQQQATASSSCPEQQQATASSIGPHQQQQASASSSCLPQLEGAAAASIATHLVAEASETETREQHQQQQLVTPRETRASKKRKAELSPTVTPSTPGGIPQMDGLSDNTPTGRPSPPHDDTNGGPTTIPSRLMPAYRAPPTPPPWSQHLPKHPCKVICYLCLADSHYTHYNQCETCHYRRQNSFKI